MNVIKCEEFYNYRDKVINEFKSNRDAVNSPIKDKQLLLAICKMKNFDLNRRFYPIFNEFGMFEIRFKVNSTSSLPIYKINISMLTYNKLLVLDALLSKFETLEEQFIRYGEELSKYIDGNVYIGKGGKPKIELKSEEDYRKAIQSLVRGE